MVNNEDGTIRKGVVMIKNDVLVQLVDCTFWLSDFKWLLLEKETIKTMLIDNSYFTYDPVEGESLKEIFKARSQIIHDAWIEYEKRNREYVIAMENGGVLPSKPISCVLGKTVYYQDGTNEIKE